MNSTPTLQPPFSDTVRPIGQYILTDVCTGVVARACHWRLERPCHRSRHASRAPTHLARTTDSWDVLQPCHQPTKRDSTPRKPNTSNQAESGHQTAHKRLSMQRPLLMTHFRYTSTTRPVSAPTENPSGKKPCTGHCKALAVLLNCISRREATACQDDMKLH